MNWIDAVFWWTGAMVFMCGGFLAFCLVVTWPIAYVFRQCTEFSAILQVIEWSNHSGISIRKKPREPQGESNE